MNTYLLVLIFSEFIFIIISYYSEIGYLSVLPAGVYSVLALVDINSKNRNLSWLVVIMTAGIAIPRLLIQYHNIEEKNKNILISEKKNSVPLPPVYVPVMQKDCETLKSWQIPECFRNNRIEATKENRAKEKIYIAEAELHKEISVIQSGKIEIPLHDYGLFFLYICLSVSMPSAVLILLYTDSEEDVVYEKRAKQSPQKKDSPREKPLSRTTIWRHKKKLETMSNGT